MNGSANNSNSGIYLLGHTAIDRMAYRLLLSTKLGYDVAVDSDFTPTAVWTAMRSHPDLALVNCDTPRANVVDAIQMIARLRPGIRILILSTAVEPNQLASWARCPMRGYVVKDAGPEELSDALDTLLAGGTYYSNGIQATLCQQAHSRDGVHKLSRRESELLPLLARGLTLRDAAASMAISYKTADSYRTGLLRKLGLRDRVELARYAIRQHIIEP